MLTLRCFTLRLTHHTPSSTASTARRLFSTTPPALRSISRVPLPPRPKPPPESEIEEKLLKGSGPGGQKINKTSSAVQLKHVPTGIVIKSQATRSLNQNRKIARNLLAERLDDLHNGDESRASIVGALKKKKRDNADKKSRRKYKQLNEGSDDEDDAKPAPKRGKPLIIAVRADKEQKPTITNPGTNDHPDKPC